MPGQLNVVFGEHRSREQQRHLQADDGDHRDQRIAEGVVAHHLALGDAARLGGLDVVALHRLQDVDPDEPDEDADDQQSQRDRRQDQVPRTSVIDSVSPLKKASTSRMWVRSGTMNFVSELASPEVGSPSGRAIQSWASRPTKKIGAAYVKIPNNLMPASVGRVALAAGQQTRAGCR